MVPVTQVQPQMPAQLADPTGETAREQAERLKAQYPDVRKGTTAEIPAELEAAYRYAQLALDYWRNQQTLIANQIRTHVGTAQTATCNGVPVCGRRVYQVPEKVVPAHVVDGFWPATGTKASNT